MQKFIFALILFFGVLFFISQFAELERMLNTLQQADWYFVLPALVLIGLWLLFTSATYQAIYAAMGIEEKIHTLLPIVLAANFTNVVAPSAGVSGVAIFLAEARRRGYSTARTTAANAVFLELEYLSLLAVLSLGLIVFIRRQNLDSAEIVASGILVVQAAVLAILIYLGTRSGKRLAQTLTTSVRLINAVLRPVLRRQVLSEERAEEFAHDISEGLQVLRDRPQKMIKPFLLSLGCKGLLLLILLLVFLDFRVPVSPGALVASFSMAALFQIVSPTPAGIGFVEGALTLTLVSMRVPTDAAAVIALTYRALTFWFPLLLGMISLRWLRKIVIVT